jgi:hypothetical protein
VSLAAGAEVGLGLVAAALLPPHADIETQKRIEIRLSDFM